MRREKSPSHALRDPGLMQRIQNLTARQKTTTKSYRVPKRHGEQTLPLSEDHLLPRLGGDGLHEHLGGRTRVQVLDEA